MGPPKDRGIPLPTLRYPWPFYTRQWAETWIEHLEERAGIIEYDAGQPRWEAESAAIRCVLSQRERAPKEEW